MVCLPTCEYLYAFPTLPFWNTTALNPTSTLQLMATNCNHHWSFCLWIWYTKEEEEEEDNELQLKRSCKYAWKFNFDYEDGMLLSIQSWAAVAWTAFTRSSCHSKCPLGNLYLMLLICWEGKGGKGTVIRYV